VQQGAVLAHFPFPWLVCATFGLAVASAVFPWMSAEVIVLALPALAPTRPGLVGLLLAATAGQMAGKCIVYWVGRRGARHSSPRVKHAIDRWRDRLANWKAGPMGLVFLSSTVGLPPFFVVTAMAGALRVDFLRFLVAGTAGRLVRFGALIFVPQIVSSIVCALK
jgi:membrane protein YqaA with SNARE-associated domain